MPFFYGSDELAGVDSECESQAPCLCAHGASLESPQVRHWHGDGTYAVLSSTSAIRPADRQTIRLIAGKRRPAAFFTLLWEFPTQHLAAKFGERRGAIPIQRSNSSQKMCMPELTCPTWPISSIVPTLGSNRPIAIHTLSILWI